MFNSPFSYFAPTSRQSFYPSRSRGNQRGGYFYQEPNFWEYDRQAAAEQEYRERLAQLQYQEQRRKAYLRQQQQLEKQYFLQQQQEHEQEMLEEQQRLQQLKAKKERRRQCKERHLKRTKSGKTEQSENKPDKVIYQPNLPTEESEQQSDDETFFDTLTGNVNESETEHETESVPTSPSYTLSATSDNTSNDSSSLSGSEMDSDSSTYTSTLKTLETQINSNVDIYNRITSALSRDTGAPNPTVLNSRLKVVQQAQIALEKLYEKLDDLAAAPTAADKRLRQQLTRTAVAHADKTELLFKDLKNRLYQAKVEASPKRKITVESVPDEDLSL